MYFKLKKDMPKHELGDIIYLSDDNVYEWLDYPNYILPKNIVEDNDEYFEKIDIDWNKGDKIFFIDNCGSIVEHIYNPKIHLKLILNKNAFKNFEEVEWVSEKFKLLLNKEIVICEPNDLLSLMNIVNKQKNKNSEEIIAILKKIINK